MKESRSIKEFSFPIGHYYAEFSPEKLGFKCQPATVPPADIISLRFGS